MAANRSNQNSGSSGRSRGGMTARGARGAAAALRTAADRVPLRVFGGVLCMLLFLMFLSVLIHPDGALPIWVSTVWKGLHGKFTFLCSLPTLAWLTWVMLGSKGKKIRLRCFCIGGLLFLTGCLNHMLLDPVFDTQIQGLAMVPALYNTGVIGMSGGVLCGGFAMLLDLIFGRFFSYCLIIMGLILCGMGAIRISPLDAMERMWESGAAAISRFRERRREEEEPRGSFVDNLIDRIATWRADRAEQRLLITTDPEEPEISEQTRRMIEEYESEEPAPRPEQVLPSGQDVLDELASESGTPQVPVKKKVSAQEAAHSAALVEQEIAAAQAAPKTEYCFPPIDLLTMPRGRAADGTAEMRENTRRLNETLASFKIDAHISNVTRGPSVTRYEVELEKGVRLNKLTTCADDIALSLGASGVRIAPVPGKISVVGIEVPNQAVSVVSLREVIDSTEFVNAKSHSAIAVGKDIGGSCIIGNIAKFPHMLIAGTTGSGKSVCMNSIIISLLYKSSPEDVKLIMVDPKMVELGIYNGIPHLLIPVVTDPKKAAGSLQWAVTEMMRRYRSMSDAGVRDLESYNSMILGGEIEGEKLPEIVVIIDELADLMLVAAKEVEESICRIAQMGRAAGIHLIIATQRPSADVITGLMKANIPSRIAFSVASAMESRIILDTVGAEKLVGKGDMLYSPIGSGKPQRVQGCFVTDPEVEAVANYVKQHYATTYDQTVMDDIARKAEQTGKNTAPPTASDPDPSAAELEGDEMLPEAVEVILETKQASVSMLQRRLKLGYARAARIVDEMEEKGIVGPFMGSKPRQILITKEQWEQMKGGQTLVVEPPFDVDDPVPDELM